MKQWLIDNWFLLITAAVAVYAAVLSTVGERRSRRRQRAMSKEEVSARAFGDPPLGPRKLCVEVVNTGQCDVFIRDVMLRGRKSPKDQGYILTTWDPRAHRALTRGDKRIYMAAWTGFENSWVPILKKFRAESPDGVWIVVRSNKRELARIDGAEVFRVIDEVLLSTN